MTTDATAEQAAQTKPTPTRREARHAARPVNQQALDELAAREAERQKTEQAAQTERAAEVRVRSGKMDELDEIEAALDAVQAAVADIAPSGSSLGSSIQAVKDHAKEGLDQVRAAQRQLEER